MRLTCSILAFSVALVVFNSLGAVQAATFSAVIGGQNYTVVELDPFKSGDVPGNTVDVANPGNFWASTSSSNNDSLWNERSITGFASGYESLPGATNRAFEASYVSTPGGDDMDNAPSVRTTVSGLPANQYDVFAIYLTRVTDQDDSRGRGVRAALNSDVVSLGTDYNFANALAFVNANSAPWRAAIAKIGTTASGSTGFYVEQRSLADNDVERSDMLAIAYQLTPVPEPSSALLIVLGAAGCLRVVRRRRK